jgi:hypothetical protein
MWNPNAIIYQSNGTTPVYTISDILAPIDGWPNTDNPKNVTYSNIRSAGELSVSGGSSSFEIGIRGRLKFGSYEDLISAWNTLQSTIVANTSYVLKIKITSTPTYSTFNVKRKGKIEIEKTDNFNSFIYFLINFTANAW